MLLAGRRGSGGRRSGRCRWSGALGDHGGQLCDDKGRVVENVVVRVTQNEVPGTLKHVVATSISRVLYRAAMIRAVDLHDHAFTRPQQVDDDRGVERIEVARTPVPLSVASPRCTREGAFEGLLGIAVRCRSPRDRG